MASTTAQKTDLTIANTIAQQIGHKAFVMMGTTHKGGTDRALSFDVKGTKFCTHIRVTLDAMDTYTMEFIKVPTIRAVMKGATNKTVDTVEGVYFDQLREIIERRTGLYLSL